MRKTFMQQKYHFLLFSINNIMTCKIIFSLINWLSGTKLLGVKWVVAGRGRTTCFGFCGCIGNGIPSTNYLTW